MGSRRADDVMAAALGALAAVGVAGALVSVRDPIGNTNVALLLVIVIVAAAALGGRLAGVVTAIAAAASFNFFHTRPLYSLHIDSSNDVWTVVLLLVVGVAVGEIAILGRRRRTQAAVQKAGVRRLERVSALLAAGTPTTEVWHEVADAVRDELHLSAVRLERTPPYSDLPALDRQGRFPSREMHWTSEGIELPRSGVAIPIEAAGAHYGQLVLVPTPGRGTSVDERQVAVALADQLAIALARDPVIETEPGDRSWPTSS